MFIPFDNLPASSKLWLYQSLKPLTKEIKISIEKKIEDFLSQWDAHGKPLQASYKIFYDHFLVIAVNESYNQASGCSIDKSTQLIQEIEKSFNLNLFDRLNQAIIIDGTIEFKTLKQIKEEIEMGNFKSDTIVFNNLINTIEGLENSWQIPASQSWLNKFIPVAS